MINENRCMIDCIYNTLLTQSFIRRTLYSNIINGLSSLLAIQNLVRGHELPRWDQLNEQLVRRTIYRNTISYIKANNNVKKTKEILRNGCPTCRLMYPETVELEELLADLDEEALFDFIDNGNAQRQ